MKKNEKRFIFAVLLLALLLWGIMTLLRPHSYGSIRITVDGTEYGIYSLDEDQIISIGDTNVCEIKDGKVRMTQAQCPDQLCIKQGAIDTSGGMIVCLPNKVTIEGEKTENSGTANDGVDSVS